jgi:hypothetical protein
VVAGEKGVLAGDVSCSSSWPTVAARGRRSVASSSSLAAGCQSRLGVVLLCFSSSSWLYGGGSLCRGGRALDVWYVVREFSPVACGGVLRRLVWT